MSLLCGRHYIWTKAMVGEIPTRKLPRVPKNLWLMEQAGTTVK